MSSAQMSSAQKSSAELREEASRAVLENGYHVLRRTFRVEADNTSPEPPFTIPCLGLIQTDDLERFPCDSERLDLTGPHLKDTGPYIDPVTRKSDVLVVKFSRKAGKPHAKLHIDIEKRTKGQ